MAVAHLCNVDSTGPALRAMISARHARHVTLVDLDQGASAANVAILLWSKSRLYAGAILHRILRGHVRLTDSTRFPHPYRLWSAYFALLGRKTKT